MKVSMLGINSDTASIINSVNSVENKQVRLGMHFLNKTTSDAQVTRNVTDIIVQDFKVSNIPVTVAIAYFSTFVLFCSLNSPIQLGF
jgi:hypothetical protein